MDIHNWFTAKSLRCIAIGTGVALLLTLILSFVAGAIIYFSPLADSNLLFCSALVEALALFGGGFWAAKLHGSRGLIIGLICAVVVWLILLIFGAEGLSPVISLCCCLIPGMAGGLLGRS